MVRGRKNAVRTRLAITQLEDRTNPSLLIPPAVMGSPYAVGVQDTGDAVVYNADGTVNFRITQPYGSTFTGGVRVALADVTGDGTADLITAPGPGIEPLVKVYDGSTHQLVDSFDAYEKTFTGGVYVAGADLNGDGKAEIVVGTDRGGGPRVEVFDGATVTVGNMPSVLDSFLAIDDPNFRGGVRVSLGDVNNDGVPDLVVGAGFGGGPRVAVFDGAALAKGQQVKLFNDFFAFESTLRNGVYPTVGDLNGDGHGDLIFGAGPGGAPRVLALDGQSLQTTGQVLPLANFFAGSVDSRDGVQVGVVTGSNGGSIVGVDLSTHTATVFSPTGTTLGSLGGNAIGGTGCISGLPPSEVGEITANGPAIDPMSLVGNFNLAAEGSLTTTAANGTRTTNTANVAVSIQIASAEADNDAATRIKVSGTAVISIDGLSSATGTFNGYVVSTKAADGTTSERLQITSLGSNDDATAATAVPSAGSSGFVLGGTIFGSSVTANWFTAFDTSSPGYVFTYPAPPTPPTSTDPSLVEGTYTWSGTGTLTTPTGNSTLPTRTETGVTVTVDIQNASPFDSIGGHPSLALAISGMITYTIDGKDPIAVAFSGVYEPSPIPSESSAKAIGHIQITQLNPVLDPPGPGVDITPFLPKTGFTLGGTLTGGTLSVDNFNAFDHSNAPTGYVFNYPALPAPPAPIDPSSLVGTDTWTGTGTLFSLPPTTDHAGGTPANATLTVKITSATAAAINGASVEGTITIAIDGKAAQTEAFSGFFEALSNPSASPVAGLSGRLRIHSPSPTAIPNTHGAPVPPPVQTGFSLDGTLFNGSLNVDSFVAYDNTNPSSGYSFVVQPHDPTR